jgi:hypothetical protein
MATFPRVSNIDQGAFAKLLHDWSGPESFSFVGFGMFALGLPGGFRPTNQTMMMVIIGLRPKYDDFFTGEVYISGGLRWGRIFFGAIFAAMASISAYLAYISN